MATFDLINRARANQALFSGTAIIALSTDENNLVDALVSAVSSQLEKYCNRDFKSQSYDELYGGSGEGRLLLRQYPIQSVESVRYRPVTVLKITNTTAANVQARVSVTSTGLKLVRVNAGVKT